MQNDEGCFKGNFCTVITHDVQHTGHIAVIIRLSNDLPRQLASLLRNSVPGPDIPGWVATGYVNSGYVSFIPIPEKSGGRGFSGSVVSGEIQFCVRLHFINGETRYNYAPARISGPDALPRDKVAAAICTEMDRYMQNILRLHER